MKKIIFCLLLYSNIAIAQQNLQPNMHIDFKDEVDANKQKITIDNKEGSAKLKLCVTFSERLKFDKTP